MRHEHGGNIYKRKCLYDFSANINPLGMSEKVKKAYMNAFSMCENYPDPECTELRKLLSKKENMEFGRIICSNGAAELIFAICFYLKPKKALLSAPCFAEYEQALLSSGCEVEKYVLKEEKEFIFDEGFIESITNDTDIVFFTNPNNPTGIAMAKSYVKKIIDRCVKTNTYLVLDECFVDFIRNGSDFSAKEYINEGNIVILKAFTKFYSMPGLRLGYGLFSSKEFAENVRGFLQTWNVSTPAQEVGKAALKEDIEEETLNYIEKEKNYLIENMTSLCKKIYGKSANFIFFKESKNFGEEMFKRGIMVRSCKNYYSLDESFYRIAVRTHEENEKLIEAWKDIKRSL